MTADAGAIYNRRLAEHMQAVKNPATQLLVQEAFAKLGHSCRDASSASMMKSAGCLRTISHFYAREGLLQLHAGNSDGWMHIGLSCNYRAWHERIVFTNAKHRGALATQALSFLLAFANIVMFRLNVEGPKGKWFENTLVSLITTDFLRNNRLLLSPLPAFCAWLLIFVRPDLSSDLEGIRPSEPYSEIIDSWNDQDKLSAAIGTSCDFHCEHADITDAHLSEFSLLPFDLIPFEVNAIYRIREAHRLLTPNVSHALLDTPCGRCPTIAYASDDHLDEVIINYCNVWPSEEW